MKVSSLPYSESGWSRLIFGTIKWTINWSWWEPISLPRNGQVSVSRSGNSGVGVTVSVIKNGPSKIRKFTQSSRPQPQFSIISSHIFCAFQCSHIGLPELCLMCYWLVKTDHVKVISERHCKILFSDWLGLLWLLWSWERENKNSSRLVLIVKFRSIR